MCAHTRKEFSNPAEVHKKDAVWFNKIPGNNRNCTWQVGSIPASKNNVKKAKTYHTSEFLCSSIASPPQHATIITTYDSGASNNYWNTEDMLVITNLKDTRDGPTVKLPNNATMNAKKTGSIPLSISLRNHARFIRFWWIAQCHTYLLRSAVWQWMHIHIRQELYQYSEKQDTYFKGTKKQDIWFMVHTHINTIDTSRSYNHHKRQDENIIDPIYSWILIHPHPKKFPEGNKNENFLMGPGLNNQHFLKH